MGLRVLRLIGLLEGISYLLLLAVAMPLKYAFGWPLGVRIVGMAHGVLFIGFVITLLREHGERDWGFGVTARAFVWSLVPLGFIPMDRLLGAQAVLPDKAASADKAAPEG